MSQNRTFDFVAPRKTELLNRQQFKVAPTGIHAGYNVVIDTGTVGAADTIKIVNAPDLTSVAVSREGVRIEESGPDPISSLSVTTADGSNPRIDIVVIQHTFSSSNNPATYAVIAGTHAASPVPPAVPTDAVVLAEVSVATSAASITNDNIIRRAKELASLNTPGTSRLTGVENTTHAPVADITALKAIPPEERADNQVLLVKDDGTTVSALYRFDSSSTDTADGLTIVIPNVFSLGTAGRWFRLPVSDAAAEGVFVAKIGGSTPDYAGSSIRTALSDFENSGREFALFIVRESMDFSGGDLTVSKPFKMVGQAQPGSSRYTFAFNGADVLTLDPETLSLAGFIEAEFVGIDINRGTGGTGGILFPENSSLRLRFSRIVDQATAGGVDFIRFTSNGTIELESSLLVPATNQSLISGTFVTVICRKSNITDTTGETFNIATLELHLRDETLYRADNFTNVTTLRIWMDGTSLLVGITQIPAGFTNLEISGKDLWTSSIGGVTLSDAVNFNLSGHLQLPNIVSLGSSILTISRSDLVVSGTKAGSEGTRIEGSPSSTTNSMIVVTGDRVRLEGIVFRCSPSVAAHAVPIVSAASAIEDFEVVDCEFQAKGPNGTSSAIFIGTLAVLSGRTRIENCWVRSSPDTPALFISSSAVMTISGVGEIKGCLVENFIRDGIRAFSTVGKGVATRISNCVVDMSSCTSTIAVGITAKATFLSNCRVHCPNLTTNLDTALAIEVDSQSGEGSLIDNCQISGLGSAATRRIGIGMSILSSASLCKISGCGIKDFRKQGIKIAGDLNVVVHNVISSINDGTDSPAIEAVSGADNNLVDANLETTTSGYVDGGATNHFDVLNTDNTGNKTI